MSDAKPKLGFVGLGNMGSPMTRNLVTKGYEVTGYDINRPLLLQRAQEIGFHAAETLADTARRSDIVITMLPNGKIVREATLGKDGIAEGMKPGALLIDMSSAGATGTAALGAELAKRGITLIDAPVSGGVTGAVAGTLAIMIGGDDAAAIERAKPILAAMGAKLFIGGSSAPATPSSRSTTISARPASSLSPRASSPRPSSGSIPRPCLPRSTPRPAPAAPRRASIPASS